MTDSNPHHQAQGHRPANSGLRHDLTCPHADLVKYWRKPSDEDWLYKSHYELDNDRTGTTGEKFVTFEPDVGGWNNIRMQMEIVMVFALATGRTLVLPPDQPMYLLFAGKGHENVHSFADYFPFEWISKRMSVITMEEFLQREGASGRLFNRSDPVAARLHTPLYPPGNRTVVRGDKREERWAMWDYLRAVSACPTWNCNKQYLVLQRDIDFVNTTQRALQGDALAQDIIRRERVFAGTRSPVYYDRRWHEERVVHFISKPEAGYRLLQHWYTFMFFEDEYMDRFYKRFVRDYVHYIDTIFCRAALIVDKLLAEGNGAYTAFHVRR